MKSLIILEKIKEKIKLLINIMDITIIIKRVWISSSVNFAKKYV